MNRLINVSYKFIVQALAALSVVDAPAIAEKIAADTPLLLLGSQYKALSKVTARDDVIVSSRIVYARLAVANEDIYGSDGKVVGADSRRLLLTKGAQMFGVIAPNGQNTYCSVDHKPVGALDGVFVMNRDKHTCFIDRDRDGLFEASYDLRTKFSSVPIYYDVEITGNPLAKAVGYTDIDPTELALPFEIEVFVEQIAAQGAKSKIGVRLKSGKNVDYLQGSLTTNLSEKPSSLQIFGADLTLMRRDKKSMNVEVSKGIDRQEFTTNRPDVSYNIIVYR